MWLIRAFPIFIYENILYYGLYRSIVYRETDYFMKGIYRIMYNVA